MRLVDADMVIKTIPTEEINARMAIATAPTIEAEPIKHGQWVFTPTTGRYRCSACEKEDKIIPWGRPPFDYCPHCGAKMDERWKK